MGPATSTGANERPGRVRDGCLEASLAHLNDTASFRSMFGMPALVS